MPEPTIKLRCMIADCFFGQVERFACLYTSHVSNLSFYSPNKSYRGRMDHMAHEEEPPFANASPAGLSSQRPVTFPASAGIE